MTDMILDREKFVMDKQLETELLNQIISTIENMKKQLFLRGSNILTQIEKDSILSKKYRSSMQLWEAHKKYPNVIQPFIKFAPEQSNEELKKIVADIKATE